MSFLFIENEKKKQSTKYTIHYLKQGLLGKSSLEWPPKKRKHFTDSCKRLRRFRNNKQYATSLLQSIPQCFAKAEKGIPWRHCGSGLFLKVTRPIQCHLLQYKEEVQQILKNMLYKSCKFYIYYLSCMHTNYSCLPYVTSLFTYSVCMLEVKLTDSDVIKLVQCSKNQSAYSMVISLELYRVRYILNIIQGMLFSFLEYSYLFLNIGTSFCSYLIFIMYLLYM